MVILFVDGPDNIENRKPPLVLFFVQDGADLMVFIESYRYLVAHLPLYLFANSDIKFYTVTHTFTHLHILTFTNTFTHLHINAFKYWLHMVADLSLSNQFFKIYTLTHSFTCSIFTCSGNCVLKKYEDKMGSILFILLLF